MRIILITVLLLCLKFPYSHSNFQQYIIPEISFGASKRSHLTRYVTLDGFGGLVVSMLASGTQVCGFKPGQSRWIFTGVKILSMPSSGGEVKDLSHVPALQHVKEPSDLRKLQIAS